MLRKPPAARQNLQSQQPAQRGDESCCRGLLPGTLLLAVVALPDVGYW